MRKFILFFKGILIGIALVLPGLSGSLMAVLLGLYESIVEWLSAVRKNLWNLLVLCAGAGIGILISAKMVLVICVAYPAQSNLFFLGLVAGGLPLLINRAGSKHFTPKSIPIAVLGFMGVFLLSVLSPVENDFQTVITQITGIEDGMILLLAGFVSCGLMMLPGVSGSVLLILMGQYGTVYGAVSALSESQNWLRALPICLLFAIGGMVGVLFVSNLMRKALNRFGSEVAWLILGLTFGTCSALAWMCIRKGSSVWSQLFWLMIGFVLTKITAKFEVRRELV